MILYTDSELEEIRRNIGLGSLKFKLSDSNLVFSKSGDYLIQRVQNKFLGLAYNTQDKTFILNYPHISNKDDTTIVDGFIEPKYNGTNYAYLQDEKGNRYFRTRGSINPELIINTINSAILNNEYLAGIDKATFDSWKNKYLPIFEKGKSSGYIDQFGNFILSNVNAIIKQKLSLILNSLDYKIVGIFGELISPYNPIAVDINMKFGQYLNLNTDFAYIIFDIIIYRNGSYEFVSPEIIRNLFNDDEYIKSVEYQKLSDLNSMLDKYDAEEGLVLKTEFDYFKIKRDDVLNWERMMGKISNVMKFSIEHIVSELGFSKEEVMYKNVYLSKQYITEVKVSIWNEIKSYNITKENLISYYKSESKMNEEFDSFMEASILSGVASVLYESGVPKEKLYSEFPKYYYFSKSVLKFNEKRQKFIPATKEYARLVSRIIGKVYLNMS